METFDDIRLTLINTIKKNEKECSGKKFKVSDNVYIYFDQDNRFGEMFNVKSGFYLRTGILDKDWNDTGIDPFMRNKPQLIDVGIMGRCTACGTCRVGCYQKANNNGKNMSLEEYKALIDDIKPYVFQLALGGAGNVSSRDDLEELLKYTVDNGIVPSFTDAGIDITKEKAQIIKKYCGACAISYHPISETDYSDCMPYTKKAVKTLINAGVKTYIHYVLSKNSINEAIRRIKNDDWPKGLHAIVFLLYKPVGYGKQEYTLNFEMPEVKEFFELIDNYKGKLKIGFDSCTAPYILHFCHNINLDSIDTCEGGRFSMYIDAEMNAIPCSFGNQDTQWKIPIAGKHIVDVWQEFPTFKKVRRSLSMSCSSCKDRMACMGGCPLIMSLCPCEKKEKDKK